MGELSLSPPDEEEYFCPTCGEELGATDIVFIQDGAIIGCEDCIEKYELSEWAEKNYISKADIQAEKWDMERDWRKYINE